MTPIFQHTKYIENIPKAELHVHIEGTLEPELLFSIAQRNDVQIPYRTVDELRAAYQFGNLQDFLDIYYQGAAVLIKEIDFYDLTFEYLAKLHKQNVMHVEIMFDPQTHTHRGVSMETIFNGITRAQSDAEQKWGLSSKLILSFLRHLSEDDAIKTLEQALLYREQFFAVGLDSSELGHPPKKFQRVYEMARKEGFVAVAHAGEEGPSENIIDALELLKVQRIDHGNSCTSDDQLMKVLAQKQIPLTLCPLSNLALKVIDRLEDHPLLILLNKGLLVTINSDDPAYFGGSLNDNFVRTAEALNLRKDDITQLAINSFKGSFLSEAQKNKYIETIHAFAEKASAQFS